MVNVRLMIVATRMPLKALPAKGPTPGGCTVLRHSGRFHHAIVLVLLFPGP